MSNIINIDDPWAIYRQPDYSRPDTQDYSEIDAPPMGYELVEIDDQGTTALVPRRNVGIGVINAPPTTDEAARTVARVGAAVGLGAIVLPGLIPAVTGGVMSKGGEIKDIIIAAVTEKLGPEAGAIAQGVVGAIERNGTGGPAVQTYIALKLARLKAVQGLPYPLNVIYQLGKRVSPTMAYQIGGADAFLFSILSQRHRRGRRAYRPAYRAPYRGPSYRWFNK